MAGKNIKEKLKGKEQRLTDKEKRLLKNVFGNQLDVSVIRVFVNGSLSTAGDYSRGLGNNIYLTNYPIDDHTLIHEAAHVWQFQNAEGWPYMYAVSSVFTYAADIISDWGLLSTCSGMMPDPQSCKRARELAEQTSATDYKYYEEMGIPFTEWNSEAQAEWIAVNGKLHPSLL